MRALVIVWNKEWDLCEPLRRVGVDVETLGPPPVKRARRLRWALRIMRKDMREFDLVIGQASGVIGLLATRAAQRQGCLAALNLRGDPWQECENHVRQGSKSRLKASIDLWAARRSMARADLLIPVSSTVGGWLMEKAGFDPGKMFVVPVPVDLDRFPPVDPAERPAKLDHPCLISFATMFQYRQKIAGLERYLPVMRAVVERHDVGVVIAGDGPLRDEFMQANSELLDHPAIHMPGYVKDMPSLYQWSDIVCHFSLLDTLGAVLLEGWASGLPVVVNDYAPLTEHVRPGVNGYILSDGPDMEEALTVFDRLITSPEHRRALGRNGRKLVETEFTPEAIGAQLLQAIEQTTGQTADG